MKTLCRPAIILLAFFQYATLNAQCWKIVTLGGPQSVGIRQDGTLWSWGSELYGELGNGPAGPTTVPTQIGSTNTWKSVSTSPFHSLAVQQDGSLWSWGYNGWGQLGDNSITDRNAPVRVGTATDWNIISAGGTRSYAIKQDGTLWGWGNNLGFRLGDGTNNLRRQPVQLGLANDWKDISAGDEHVIALKQDGSLWSWGANAYGELGDGTFNDRPIPLRVGTANDWKVISAGLGNSMAIKQDGTLWAWGYNIFGQLGNGLFDNVTAPTQIGTDNDWASIMASGGHTIALKQNGTLWTWGRNNYGQLGDNSLTDHITPVQLGTETDWKMNCTSVASSSALTRGNGTLWVWGYNADGQLGDGSITNRLVPVQIGAACSILPVHLLSFSGRTNGMENILEWSTSSELNNKYFVIEKSTDGSHFREIGRKEAAANGLTVNNYSFSDIQVSAAVNYYRLRQFDIDGTSSVSKTIKINSNLAIQVQIYPNPVKDVLYVKGLTKTSSFVITNSAGQIVQSGSFTPGKPLRLYGLQTGVFFLQIEKEHLKFLKQ